MWNLIVNIISKPKIAEWIIKYAKREPYFHLDGYMNRWWVFNPYTPENRKTRYPFPISIRVHHILREDLARDPHDHPWNARTIILNGWYLEERDGGEHYRTPGDTAQIKFGEYHNVKKVSEGGVWTLFITGKYRGQWGFRVGGLNGIKVPHTEY